MKKGKDKKTIRTMDDNKNARNSYNKKFSVDSIFLIKI